MQDNKLPQNSAVAYLSETVYSEHKFKSFGFRKPRQFAGLFSDLKIRGRTREISVNTSFSQDVLQIYSDEIEEGMSGSAVLDLEIDQVVGIVFQHNDTRGTVDTMLNFAIPIESILKEIPTIESILREKNPGLNPKLRKINRFMQAIVKSGSFVYDRFEDVYVAPIEYGEIEKTLKENRCIFIIGSPEYGKTYTAIKLLWEYYKDGYTPKFIEEGSKETNDMISKLVNQDKSLANNIIYIEDPVGRTEYRSNKQFEESIESIISGLGHLNADLVVTMREEIYQKFNPIGKEDLKKYIKKLNNANHSYKKGNVK